MGFDPALVGLPGPVTGRFLEPRPDGCPHKGLDIGSSRVSMPFSAGVFGRVILPNPADSAWCTIAVQPFHDLQATVQYLHGATSNVNIGDLVAPWTVIGSTGDCSPTPVPIHLHIQVVYPGAPAYACWGNRNFVNPETWDTGDPLVGLWSYTENQPGISAIMQTTIDNVASSGRIGSNVTEWRLSFNLPGGSCETDYKMWGDLICTGFSQENILNLTTENSQCIIVDSTCSKPINAVPREQVLQCILDSASGLTVLSEGETKLFTKGARLADLSSLELVSAARDEMPSLPESGLATIALGHFGIPRIIA